MNNRAIYTEEFFESYLRDEVIPPEREAFEEALKNDADLRKDFEAHSKLFRGMEYHFEEQLRNKIKSSMNVEDKEETTAKIRRFNPMSFGIAASLLLIAAAGFLFLKSNGNSGFKMTNDHFVSLFEMESNQLSNLGFASEDKLIASTFLTDFESLAYGNQSFKLKDLPVEEQNKPFHALSSMKYYFYENLYKDNFEEARRYLNFMKRYDIEEEQFDFLSCVLEYSETKGESDCMNAFKKSKTKSIQTAAKSF